jgi:hypothetical protein
MKNIVEPDRSQMTITRRMSIAYWTPKATNSHSQSAITIALLLQQKWLHERASSMLRYTYIVYLVLLLVFAVGSQMSIVLCKEQLPSEQTSVET